MSSPVGRTRLGNIGSTTSRVIGAFFPPVGWVGNEMTRDKSRPSLSQAVAILIVLPSGERQSFRALMSGSSWPTMWPKNFHVVAPRSFGTRQKSPLRARLRSVITRAVRLFTASASLFQCLPSGASRLIAIAIIPVSLLTKYIMVETALNTRTIVYSDAGRGGSAFLAFALPDLLPTNFAMTPSLSSPVLANVRSAGSGLMSLFT